MSHPSVRYRLIQMARDPERPTEYEDAADVRTDDWPVSAAVADGATESMYAKRWAQSVAKGLVDRKPTTDGAFRTAVSEVRRSFQPGGSNARGDSPWYVSSKAREGAHATALVLTLTAGGQWTALAVGDCCLFHVRGRRLHLAWPIDSPEAFGQRPSLLSSGSSSERRLPNMTSGHWATTDRFLLATDAVAQWLLRRIGDGQDWIQLLRLDDEAIKLELEAARDAKTLRTDDVTLLLLDMDRTGGDSPVSGTDVSSEGGCEDTRK